MLQRMKSGFTLIELLAVIAIIGVLATISAVGISGALKKGRDAVRERDLANIKNALLLYQNDEGDLPPASNGWFASTSTLEKYMKRIPQDTKPDKSGGPYKYYTDGESFILTAQLEYDKTNITLPGVDCGGQDFEKKGNGVARYASSTQRCFYLSNE